MQYPLSVSQIQHEDEAMSRLRTTSGSMTIFGVGPVWVGLTAIMTGTMFSLTSADPAAWTIPWLHDTQRVSLGIALILTNGTGTVLRSSRSHSILP